MSRSEQKRGNEYFLKCLRKDHPDVHADFEAGSLCLNMRVMFLPYGAALTELSTGAETLGACSHGGLIGGAKHPSAAMLVEMT